MPQTNIKAFREQLEEQTLDSSVHVDGRAETERSDDNVLFHTLQHSPQQDPLGASLTTAIDIGPLEVADPFENGAHCTAEGQSTYAAATEGSTADCNSQLEATEHRPEHAVTELTAFLSQPQHELDAMLTAGGAPLLAALLRSGDPEAQLQAARAIVRLADDYQEYVDAVIASGSCPDLEDIPASAQDFRDAALAAGVLPTLAKLLDSADVGMQEQAMTAITYLAGGNQQNADDTMAANILPSVLPLLKSDRFKLLDEATGLMTVLTANSKQNSEAVFATGVLPIIVGLLESDQPVIVAQTAMTIVSLAASSPQHIHAVLAIGVLPTFVALLKADEPPGCTPPTSVHASAAYMFTTLASSSQDHKDAVVAAGALPLLAARLKSDLVMVPELAAATFVNLAAGSELSKDAIIAAGALPGLVELMRPEVRYRVRTDAITAIAHLAKASQPRKDAMVALGVPPELIASLAADQEDEVVAANDT